MPTQNQPSWDDRAAALLKDTDKLRQLKDAPETRRIFAMLEQSTAGSLEQAAAEAVRGETGQLLSAIRQLMRDPEGARLMGQMREKLK